MIYIRLITVPVSDSSDGDDSELLSLLRFGLEFFTSFGICEGVHFPLFFSSLVFSVCGVAVALAIAAMALADKMASCRRCDLGVTLVVPDVHPASGLLSFMLTTALALETLPVPVFGGMF